MITLTKSGYKNIDGEIVAPSKLHKYLAHKLEIEDGVTFNDLISPIIDKSCILDEIFNVNKKVLAKALDGEPLPIFDSLLIRENITVGDDWGAYNIFFEGFKAPNCFRIDFKDIHNIKNLEIKLSDNSEFLHVPSGLESDFYIEFTLFKVLDSIFLELLNTNEWGTLFKE